VRRWALSDDMTNMTNNDEHPDDEQVVRQTRRRMEG
jgi:hypothetical protein